MTLSETIEIFDLLDIPHRGVAPEDGDRFDAAAIFIGDSARNAGLEEDRTEPSIALLPFFIGFDDPEPLDPERIGLTWELVEKRSSRMQSRSPLIALLMHVALLLLIVGWASTTNDDAPLIPVKLVIEQAPPEPEPQPVEQPPMPPQPEHAEAQSQPEPVPSPPAPTPPIHPKAQRPPAKPAPAQSAPTPPTPTRPAHPKAQIQQEQLPPPNPMPISHPAAPPPTALRPSEAPLPQFPSAGTSRDGYLAYLVTLTGQHMNLLPRSVVGTRRGETVVRVAVRRDGVIDRLSIARPSGYPDIDERVEQMVAAVGKFPPVPDAFAGSPVELDLDFFFPEALQGH